MYRMDVLSQHDYAFHLPHAFSTVIALGIVMLGHRSVCKMIVFMANEMNMEVGLDGLQCWYKYNQNT